MSSSLVTGSNVNSTDLAVKRNHAELRYFFGRLGADSLGAKGKNSETVGEEASSKLINEINSGAPVDEHAADNLILWLALLGGKFRCSRISDHTRTAVWVVERFLGPIFRVEGTLVSLKSALAPL